MSKFFSLYLFILLLGGCVCSGLDLSKMDEKVAPQEDFYKYANGVWLEETKIPDDKPRFSHFGELAEKSKKQIKNIIIDLSNKKHEKNSEKQKIADTYKAFMDNDEINSLGLKVIDKEIKRIDNITSKDSLIKEFSNMMRLGASVPFYFYVSQDQKNATKNIIYITQWGLHLARENYIEKSPRFKEIREKYKSYIESILRLTKNKTPKLYSQKILDLEIKIAKAHWSQTENRNREKTYNTLSSKELMDLCSECKFEKSFAVENITIQNIEKIVVKQPSYIKKLNMIIKDTPIDTWKNYLKLHLLRSQSQRLTDQIFQISFNFFGKDLSGVKSPPKRWKRAVSEVEGGLGEALGKIYVKLHFKAKAKNRMEKLVKNLKLAFKQSIDKLEWMSSETKIKAQNKLEKFVTKIGYPDKWEDFSSLEIKPNDAYGNYVRVKDFYRKKNIAKLDKPVDRLEWGMTPQTVNAYYSPTKNEIVFPAGILQKPFFNLHADDAANYGAIGAVIGHEISHGFDDQGRKSDGYGNLTDWWSKEDEVKFNKLTKRLVEQYSQYVAYKDGPTLNGKLTLGENIADLSGLAVAYKAYKISLKGKTPPVIDGFTGDQRFLLSWAQIWAMKYRDKALHQSVLKDPHSPGKYRVIGVMSNYDLFYKAFDVKTEDKMFVPENKRVKIW